MRVVRYSAELHEWRRAVAQAALTQRDRNIANAHAFRVELYDEGTIRGHFASNGDIARAAGLDGNGVEKAVRIANAKLIEHGLIERVPASSSGNTVGERRSRYTYLLRMP